MSTSCQCCRLVVTPPPTKQHLSLAERAGRLPQLTGGDGLTRSRAKPLTHMSLSPSTIVLLYSLSQRGKNRENERGKMYIQVYKSVYTEQERAGRIDPKILIPPTLHTPFEYKGIGFYVALTYLYSINKKSSLKMLRCHEHVSLLFASSLLCCGHVVHMQLALYAPWLLVSSNTWWRLKTNITRCFF